MSLETTKHRQISHVCENTHEEWDDVQATLFSRYFFSSCVWILKLLFGFLHRWIFKRRVRFLVIEVFLWLLQIAANCWRWGEKNKLAAILLDKIIDILKKQVKSWRVLWICVTQFPPVLFVWLVVGFFLLLFSLFCQNDKTTKKKEKKKAFNATTMDSTVVKRSRVWKENCWSSTLHLKNSLGLTFLLHLLFRDTFVFSPFVILSASSCNFDEELPC